MHASRPRRIPLVEWLAGLLSASLVLGTLAFLAGEARQSATGLPELHVRVLGARPAPAGVEVEIEVANRGRGAALDVEVMGSGPPDAGGDARVRLDFVAGHSVGRAVLVFARDPGPRPEVRITGYVRP
jgi:uncharacterized protein (TIGR02588 family)